METEHEICVCPCANLSNATTISLVLLPPYISLMRLMKAQRKKSLPLMSQEYTSWTGFQPQAASWNSTFCIIFSSCFADWTWFRYSITLKLAVVNFSCNAFTSALSAFEEKNGRGKNRILSENVELLRCTYPSGSQNLFFPDPFPNLWGIEEVKTERFGHKTRNGEKSLP